MIDRKDPRRSSRSPRRPRIGAVRYLNSKPLVEGLPDLVPEAELLLDFPSRLADELAAGRLDVALIPSVEAFSDPDYEIASDACVAARGPVMSVKLYFRTPPGEVRTLALDEGSRTSAALSRIMLAERYGAEPRLVPFPIGAEMESTAAEAVLMIGDRAMHAPAEPFHTVWDLGEEWRQWTGLPFVFAMWVTREGVELGDVETALASARDLGVERIGEISAREAPALNLTPEVARKYLTHNLHFHLGSAERQGLKLFHRLASGLGLAPAESFPTFRSHPRGLPAADLTPAHV